MSNLSRIYGACNRLMHMKKNISFQRVFNLSSITSKGHDVYDNLTHQRIARVGGIGEDEFTYYLYDESKEEKVLRHLTKLAKDRAKTHYDILCFPQEQASDYLSTSYPSFPLTSRLGILAAG